MTFIYAQMSSWGFGALLKGFTSVEDNSCQSRDSNPQPRVTSATRYPLEPRLSLNFICITDGLQVATDPIYTFLYCLEV